MKKVLLSEWKIDADNLPDKKFREATYYIHHYILETENGEYGFLFYNLSEYAMSWYAGAFAILKNKSNPVFIFNSNEVRFRFTFASDFIFGEKSSIVQLVKHFNAVDKSVEHTFCLLDFRQNLFSIISFELSDFYCLNEAGFRKFMIVLDKPENFKKYERRENIILKNYSNQMIDCASLTWSSTQYLKNYNEIYWANREKYRLT